MTGLFAPSALVSAADTGAAPRAAVPTRVPGPAPRSSPRRPGLLSGPPPPLRSVQRPPRNLTRHTVGTAGIDASPATVRPSGVFDSGTAECGAHHRRSVDAWAVLDEVQTHRSGTHTLEALYSPPRGFISFRRPPGAPLARAARPLPGALRSHGQSSVNGSGGPRARNQSRTRLACVCAVGSQRELTEIPGPQKRQTGEEEAQCPAGRETRRASPGEAETPLGLRSLADRPSPVDISAGSGLSPASSPCLHVLCADMRPRPIKGDALRLG
ncbi:hypothetical protein HPB47_006525 [Ixodes persulcatus]|uniref:Uncharacterized protein n=1 Tax=Ixodes persulcatus TaxID=34615 RepID=A0AC60PA29_IXOPE|nr:hypothetical protein HPB47_006525 [Ixodes persulcatus]